MPLVIVAGNLIRHSEAIRGRLRAGGCYTVPVADVDQLRDMLGMIRVNALLIDTEFGASGGLAVIETLKPALAAVPVIVFSHLPLDEWQHEATRLGAAECIRWSRQFPEDVAAAVLRHAKRPDQGTIEGRGEDADNQQGQL